MVHPEAESYVGRIWKMLDDGAIVRFGDSEDSSGGRIRSSEVRQAGRYRIKVTGYAYQSSEPITASVGVTRVLPGSKNVIYGFFSFPPNKSSTVEFEAWVDANYMLAIEPSGIPLPQLYQHKSIGNYDGPGLAIVQVVLEGPLVDGFPSRGHRLVFNGLNRREIVPSIATDANWGEYKPRFEIISSDEREDVTQSLKRVAAAAFRQPVVDQDVVTYINLFQQERANGASFEDALRTAVIAIFCSPRFLYVRENPGKLDDYALATRLSLFLARTTPDSELLAAAASGKLTASSDVLRAQTERLMKHSHFRRFIDDFADAWLGLRDLDATEPDSRLFPEFDAYLRYSMPRESRAFLREMIDANHPVANLVKSDFAMLNRRLAEHYDLPPVSGTAIRKVKLPADSIRGGILTHASVLKVTANGTNTSPVSRGVWVMERILGQPPASPPTGISAVEPDVRGTQTLRKLLDQHSSGGRCKVCHQRIDPPGFALECFNPIGGYRTRFRSLGGGDQVATKVLGKPVAYRLGLPVDDLVTLPDGRRFAGFKEFRNHLAQDEKLLVRTLTKKLLVFANWPHTWILRSR